MTYYDAPTAGIQALHRLKKGEELQVKIAISYTNIENARHNLAHECAHWDFDAIRRDARREWEETLSRIQVQGGDAHQRIKFYTDLWHVLLGRHKLDDVSGDYPDRTGQEFIIRTLPKHNGRIKISYVQLGCFLADPMEPEYTLGTCLAFGIG